METLMDDLMPVLDCSEDCFLSRQGDMTIGYKVILPEIFTLSDQQYEAFHQAWVKALKMLPAGSVCHKQDWFLKSKYQADFDKNSDSFLSHSSERFFHERPFLDHSCYIFLTRRPNGRKPSSSLVSNLFRPGLFPKDVLSAQALQEFRSSAGQFKRIMEDSGFVKMMQLKETDMFSTGRKAGIIERYCHLNQDENVRLLKDISFHNGIKIGDQICQLYSLADASDLPGVCGAGSYYEKYSSDKTKFSTGFASSLGQLLSCNHIYNQVVIIEDTDKTLKRLENKRLRLQSLSLHSRENHLALDATNEFLNEAIKEQRMPVKAHFNVMVWTDEPSELREIRNMTTSALAQIDATAKQEIHGAPQLFWACIPANAGDFPLNETFDTFTEQAACFFNLESSYRSSVSPVGIRLGDRLTGRPMHVDISDEPIRMGICTNRNKFILGPSGSGKSFFTNHMVRSYYETGAHIVLVDVGHSYQGLCDMVGGYYFTYEEQNPIRFNPFYIAPGEILDTEKKESIKTLLVALWKKQDEIFKQSEYVALSSALTLYYAYLEKQPDIFACFNSFYEFLQKQFTGVIASDRVKEKDFDLDNFLYVLMPYYRDGEFDYLLNADENLNLLDQRFIVFELDNIKDHRILFPIVTIIIMELFISKMRKLQGVRKVLLIEEAWKAIAREGMAEYVKYIFKTVRKYFGEAIVVTQEVEDIISSPIVKQAIINNSDCKILLDQSKYQNKFDQIQELLGLTEKEKALVLSVNKANDPLKKYKEVFISLGGVLSKVYRTEVSLEEYLTYTTEQTEKMKVTAYSKKYGSIKRGIRMLADEMRKQ
jgi:conjugation system TraG family ATPase